MGLNLMDLVPRKADFKLSKFEGKTFHLEAWSLYYRTIFTNKYGAEKLGLVFRDQRIVEIGEMAYEMLEEKEQFPELKDFLKAVESMEDQVGLIKALLATVGMGEPEIQKVAAEAKRRGYNIPDPSGAKKEPVDPQQRSPKKKIGAKSSTR